MICLDITSRNNVAKSIQKFKPDVVISIKDILKDFDESIINFKGSILTLSFEDQDIIDGPGAPEINDIIKIINFARGHKDKTFVVNCEGGISRSAAAALICCSVDKSTISFKWLVEKFPHCYPNKLMIIHAAMILQDIRFIDEFNNWQPIWDFRLFEKLRKT